MNELLFGMPDFAAAVFFGFVIGVCVCALIAARKLRRFCDGCPATKRN